MMEFWPFFFDLSSILGGFGAQALPKIHQKSSKTLQKSILSRVLDTSAFEGGFWKGFGRVLGAFWEDFGRVLGGFLGRFWEDVGRINSD